MLQKIKPYIPSIALGLSMLLASPLFLFIIFMSGDSCCGENTSGTMIGFTAVILFFHLVASSVINFLLKVTFLRDTPSYKMIYGIITTFLPSLILYVTAVTFLVITAFYL